MRSLLSAVERIGNRLPHPFALFVMLAVLVVVLSAVAAALGAGTVNPGTGKTILVRSLLSREGIGFMFTGMVDNFTGFPPMGLILVVMLGVGLADKVGLMPALMQATVTRAPAWSLTFAVFAVGICAGVASDAKYVVLIPLAAMVYQAAGRHPIAGAAAAYAAVGGIHDASFLITPTDAILSGISTQAARIINPQAHVTPLDNYFFTLPSALVLAVVGTLVVDRLIEPRLQRSLPQNVATAGRNAGDAPATLTTIERRGLRRAGWTALAYAALVALIVLPPGSPLRNAEGGLVPSPFLHSVVALVFGFFVAVGLAYGTSVGAIRSSQDVAGKMAEGVKELAPTLVLFFVIAQFLAYFKWSQLGQFVAIEGAQWLRGSGLTGLPLIVVFVLMTAVTNVFITSGSAQWSLMAPVFVPMLMLLGYEPAFVQAMFRIGDSASNIVSPMSPYFALTLACMQRYRPDMGIGTLFATMLPLAVALLLTWTGFLLLWLWADLPFGPGIHMLARVDAG
jgi:aminobenzoyl-glutamate transport protein